MRSGTVSGMFKMFNHLTGVRNVTGSHEIVALIASATTQQISSTIAAITDTTDPDSTMERLDAEAELLRQKFACFKKEA